MADAELHVTEVISNRGGRIFVNFPLVVSVDLARLVAHCFGDGNVSMKKGEFDYVNGDIALISEVKKEVERVFNSLPTYEGANGDGTYKVTFTSLIGRILELFGAPRGSKVHSKLSVPLWVMAGSSEVKKAFLQSLFDDDGSVLFSENYRAKNVNLHFTRTVEVDDAFLNYLNDLKAMLLSLEIETTKPYSARHYYVKDSRRIVRGILISRMSRVAAIANTPSQNVSKRASWFFSDMAM